ncbi:MmcQ/YjbR family DNA-binding protein [Sphaerisporangium aureirubrum]|uniref:MmcQ/YjbR family DNA-binding protein n=1 Tax=Sphaerisporangium aureirubrum TaxID=1544736 RepID=A0ABW1NGB3_9ACTN
MTATEPPITADDVRQMAMSLPRTIERLVRDRVKFNVGRIVYATLSRDETLMGCGFPKEEREAAVAAEPEKFLMPDAANMRYQWIVVRLSAVTRDELRELLVDAWRMAVPKRVAAAYDQEHTPA